MLDRSDNGFLGPGFTCWTVVKPVLWISFLLTGFTIAFLQITLFKGIIGKPEGMLIVVVRNSSWQQNAADMQIKVAIIASVTNRMAKITTSRTSKLIIVRQWHH
ncbi:hypothetical protein E1A91_A11G285000v1 [Gossypium mustelinum]|uniref:Uncharacterized protein n=4 Tax=Gossypium TaxID=3633 RepID=A0A5J5TU41_GOSBA|nr:hypothetical protein ES319_A11G277900v1 [Gossypium barbadense]TYG95879.1 hypothetical protein ES288_A11G303500v1 [Gossypium darwinii]TYI02900.1 hypothetical protein ES332_A11G299900v1 [Gossypium tomentosum]TYJ11570.1 hypothetical protein E1A91_A11G285000v1 [Gossypium mustelinum]